jgi:predicted glycoside hydrolase/deacetylase ChbG (UPF0249 family)
MAATRRLIVNADDFGYSPLVNEGIIESIKKGIVRSTSALANFPAIEEARYMFKEVERIASIGIHFNLTEGRPVLPPKEVYSLVDRDGNLWGPRKFVYRLLEGRIKFSHMMKELNAQVGRLISLGFSLSFFDSHQGLHYYFLCPLYFFAAILIASKNGIFKMRSLNRHYIPLNRQDSPPRKYTHLPDLYRKILWYICRRKFKMADRLIYFTEGAHSLKENHEVLFEIIENLASGTNEVYFHPRYITTEQNDYSKIAKMPNNDLITLTNPEILKVIEEKKISLISFKEL